MLVYICSTQCFLCILPTATKQSHSSKYWIRYICISIQDDTCVLKLRLSTMTYVHVILCRPLLTTFYSRKYTIIIHIHYNHSTMWCYCLQGTAFNCCHLFTMHMQEVDCIFRNIRSVEKWLRGRVFTVWYIRCGGLHHYNDFVLQILMQQWLQYSSIMAERDKKVG